MPWLALVAGLLPPTTLNAQSLTAGTLTGTVSNGNGHVVEGAGTTVRDVETGQERFTSVGTTGHFVFPLLPPGEYEIRVEQLGYRPTVVRSVVVRPGQTVEVPVRIETAEPPIVNIDTVFFGGGGSTGSLPESRFISRLELNEYPGDRAELADLGRFSSATSPFLDTEGLPGSMSGLVIDGITYRNARHPLLDAVFPGVTALPRSSAAQADIMLNGLDVEWSGFSGSILSTHTRRGGRQLEAGFFADWSGDQVADSKYFSPGDVSHSSIRTGFILSGPIIRDTAHFAIGVEARSTEAPFAGAAPRFGDVSGTISTAQSRFGVDLGAFNRPAVEKRDIVSGFGRLDWRITENNVLNLETSFSSYSADNLNLAADRGATPGSNLDGTEVQSSITLGSRISPKVYQEIRVGIEAGDLTFNAPAQPFTTIAGNGFLLGTDPAFPGAFQRTGVRLSEVLHFGLGIHRVKLGFAGRITSHEQNFNPAGNGEFFFGDDSFFGQVRGAFVQSSGPARSASFTATEFGVFLQDIWTVAPGIDLHLGLRVDAEELPEGEVTLNQEWQSRTGLSNTDFSHYAAKVSPRIGFDWRIGPRMQWLFTGRLGRYFDEFDPALLSELIINDGAFEVRRGVGNLGSWPGPPSTAAAPSAGRSLTLLGPDYDPPATTRATVGISRSLGRGASLSVSGTYRHTDFLPRRHDLNRRPAPSGADQYGRPLYGDLVAEGSVVAARANSNRRFTDFDVVYALDPDGFSDYWGVTARLEKRLSGAVSFLATYTHSETTDNWLARTGLTPIDQLSPFPDSLNGADWADGTSDYDIPDRAVLGLEVSLPGLEGVRIAGLYRFRSGAPFTPGFRGGVDANGDGSFRNDPAFVDPAVPGIAPLLADWGCLRGNLGRFADRNACRAPDVHALDLRLSIDLLRLGGAPASLVIEGLNLIESNVAFIDNALYLVDSGGSLATDPSTGVTTVPLVANPNFGKALVRRASGKRVRAGVRINW